MRTIVLPAAIAASISSLIPREIGYQRQVARFQPGKCQPFDVRLQNCLHIRTGAGIAISPRSRRRGSVATAAASAHPFRQRMPDLLLHR